MMFHIGFLPLFIHLKTKINQNMNQRTKTRYKNQLAKITPDLQEKIQTYNANERMRCITMNHRLGKHEVKVVYNLFKKQFTQLTILENTINI